MSSRPDAASGSARGGRPHIQRRVLNQDPALELLERGGRLDAELAHQQLARATVDVQGFRLSPRPIEGQHELLPQPLAQRMVHQEFLKLPDKLGVATEREVRLDPLLEGAKAELFEALDGRPRERLVRQVGERWAAPEAECPPQQVRRLFRLVRVERLRGQPLEHGQVELLRGEADRVAGRARLDRRGGSKPLPQVRDLALHLLESRHRSGTRVEIVGEPVDRDDAVRVQEQERECRPLLRPPELDDTVAGDLERSQKPVLEHAADRTPSIPDRNRRG